MNSSQLRGAADKPSAPGMAFRMPKALSAGHRQEFIHLNITLTLPGFWMSLARTSFSCRLLALWLPAMILSTKQK
jgi:hypothetical protein